MKSQKGITMISLILYVASFLAVTATVGGITTFFYNNMEILDSSIGSNSAYNKFNLYLLTECKETGNELYAWKGETTNVSRLSNSTSATNTFITFKNSSGEFNSFIYDSTNKDLYYNSIKLCDKVDDFKVKVDETTGKMVLKVLIVIDGTSFSTDYVVS